MALFNFRREAAPASNDTAAVEAFLKGFSIEVMPRTAEKVESFRDILPTGTRVYIAHIDGTPIDEMVATAKRIGAEGFTVMPHFPARIIKDKATLTDWIARYQGEADVKQGLERVYGLIPRLAELRTRTAGYLSGGEQQLLLIGRAMMAQPRLLMIDEPSLGLAPMMVSEIFALLAKLRQEGVSLLIVEQHAQAALDIADHGYILENGRVVLEGTAAELRANEDIQEFYLGKQASGERRNYREVKHYRRRKRWLG